MGVGNCPGVGVYVQVNSILCELITLGTRRKHERPVLIRHMVAHGIVAGGICITIA